MRTIQAKTPAGKIAVKILFYTGLFLGLVPPLLFLAGASPLGSLMVDLKKEHVRLAETFNDFEHCKKSSNNTDCWEDKIKEKANPNDIDFLLFQVMVTKDICENGHRIKDITSHAAEILDLETKTRDSGQRSGADNIARGLSCAGKLGRLCVLASPIEWGIVNYIGDMTIKMHLAMVKRFEENESLLNSRKCPSTAATIATINQK